MDVDDKEEEEVEGDDDDVDEEVDVGGEPPLPKLLLGVCCSAAEDVRLS